MSDLIPDISTKDIDYLITREFPNRNSSDIINVLNQYKSDSNEGRNKIWCSIIKLCKGNVKKLEYYTERAVNDYRDVLLWAETPRYLKYDYSVLSKKSRKEQDLLAEEDYKNYNLWINREYNNEILKELIIKRHLNTSKRRYFSNGLYKNDVIECIVDIIKEKERYPEIDIIESDPIYDGCIITKSNEHIFIKEYREYSIGLYKEIFSKEYNNYYHGVEDFINREFPDMSIDGISII